MIVYSSKSTRSVINSDNNAGAQLTDGGSFQSLCSWAVCGPGCLDSSAGGDRLHPVAAAVVAVVLDLRMRVALQSVFSSFFSFFYIKLNFVSRHAKPAKGPREDYCGSGRGHFFKQEECVSSLDVHKSGFERTC